MGDRREMGGLRDRRQLSGDVDRRQLSGDVDRRQLSGETCTITQCGYNNKGNPYGASKARIYDFTDFTDSDKCEKDDWQCVSTGTTCPDQIQKVCVATERLDGLCD